MAYRIDLKNEVALVTGGSRNIGLAIAGALVEAGARVCIWGGSDRAGLEAAAGALGGDRGTAMGGIVRVENEGEVLAAFDGIESQYGPVTILVNNAAERPHEPLNTLSREAWTATVDVIMTGAFLTSRELFRRLPEGRNGAIVNIGGLSAHRPARHRAHVVAAKAGLVGLTRALAEEGLGRVRANCVVPGAIETDRRAGQSAPSFASESKYGLGQPVDVARAVLSLADPAEPFVTGQTVHVNGGRFMP
ncbi:MAG: SDR family oxidoreductase [Rhodospirillaceae bacterium]|nr:SDR family oxidoreductase [Rhodospirillaceae bacterium]